MFFDFLSLPNSPLEWIVILTGILGMILIIYSQLLESLRRKDLIRLIGSTCLLVYAIWDNINIIFILTFAGIAITSLIEFIEIYIGMHRTHDHDALKYKQHAKRK